MSRWRAVLACAALVACSSQPSQPDVKPHGDSGPPPKPTFTLFALAEVRGQIGPCGCTSDPLGDIARTTKLVAAARAQGPVLVVDAGSTLFTQNPMTQQLKPQEDLKASLIRDVYAHDLQVAAVGLGPADLAEGPDAVTPPRQAANLAPDAKIATEPPKVIDVGGAKVGVFGVIVDGAVPGLAITDPIAAGKAAVAQLKQAGAQVIVGMIQAVNKVDAQHTAKAIGGIDFTIAGLGINAPEPERTEMSAEKLGDGWLIVPANRGQIIPRIDVTLRATGAAGPLADAIGSAGAAARSEEITARIASADAELKTFAADPTADPKFVASKQAERDRLAAERDALARQPLVVPAQGNYFTLDQIKIGKTLACSTAAQDKVSAYFAASGEANVKASEGIAVPAPPKGQASYVGMNACSDCHQDAVDFWQKTVHAKAWQTLVERGQQFDYSCIGCHVTGFEKPGGTNLAHTDKLRDIQCEVCHGPGSIHVAKGGQEKPFAIIRAPKQDLCASQCHTKEHSDTFQYEAYLRDITGKGHGEERRKQLGDGPTGSKLRGAALAKAGASLGAACVR